MLCQLLLVYYLVLCNAYESPKEFSIPLMDPVSSLHLPDNLTTTTFAYVMFNTASRLAVDLLNNKSCNLPDLLPNTHLHLDIRVDFALPAIAIQQMIDLHDLGHSMVLSVPLPTTAIPSSIVGNVYGMGILSFFAPETSLSDKLRYPYFSRTATSSADHIVTVQELLFYYESQASKGWTDVAMIATTDQYSIDYATSFIERTENNDITILAYQQFLVDAENISVELNEIKKSKARVIIVVILGDFSEFLVKADEFGLVGEDYVYVVAPTTVGIPFAEPQPLARGVLAAVNYFPPVSPYRECFFEAWRTADPIQYPGAGLGMDPRSVTYFPFDSIMIAATALDTLDKMEMLDGQYIPPEVWNSVIRNSTFDGITGSVSFDSNGDRIGELGIVYYNPEVNTFLYYGQRTEEGLVFTDDVIWYSNTTDIPDLDIRPAFNYWSCEDKEELEDPTGKTIHLQTPGGSDVDEIDIDYHCDYFIDCQNLSDESRGCVGNYTILFIVFGVITIVLLCIAFLLSVFVIIFGVILKYRRLRTASPFFMVLLLLSIMIGYCSVFAFFGKPHPVACGFQPWLLGLPSVSMIAALSVKTFRIYRIFKYPMKKQRITNAELFLYWTIAMIPALVILILWTIISTPTAKLEEREGKEHYVCATGGFSGEPGGYIFFSLFVAYSALVLLVGAIVSFLARNVHSLFNETKILTISIYNLGFLSVVIIPVFLIVQPINPFVAWVIRTCAVLYAFTATMVLQFLPKVFGIFLIDKGRNVRRFKQMKSLSRHNSENSLYPDCPTHRGLR